MDISPSELMVVMVIAVLIFGKRLPDVARSMGKGLSEFRRGMRGLQDEITSAATGQSRPAQTVFHDDSDDTEESTAPRFVPPPRPQRAEPAQPGTTAP